jgi:ribosomal protein S18 acetylase RimI-like enzyme
VYRKLYQQVKQLAAAQGGVRGFRLYVEKNNHAAQRTYTDLGMREAEYLLFQEMMDG